MTTFSLVLIQFDIQASDQRINERFGIAPVTVLIARDEQPPRFSGAPFAFEVSENLAVNETFERITATDPDLQVM